MKIIAKASIAKEKICKKCAFKKHCADLPGFCMLISYVPVALVVVMLVYFLFTMTL